MSKKFKWTLALFMVTPFLVIAAIIIGGGGHGYVEGVLVLFPLPFVVQDGDDGGIPLSMIIQLPLYGLIIDLSMIIFKKRTIGLIVVVFIHLLITLLAFNKL